MARPLGGYFRLVYLSFLFIVSTLVVIRSLGSLGRSTPLLYCLIIKAPWDRGLPSSAPPAPHRMLHERRFFFLASKAIVFTLSCVYGRSLFTGYLTNVIHPTRGAAIVHGAQAERQCRCRRVFVCRRRVARRASWGARGRRPDQLERSR